MADDAQEYLDFANADYASKYDAQSSILGDLTGGAVATVADFGSSVWNSLVPEKYETSTEDLLRRVSDNALRVYEEHPDAVHTASFLGGMFAPSGLALKGMGMLRNGAKGVSWFSTEARAANIAAMEEAFAQGAEATAAYRSARNSLYMSGLANQALDAAAMEFAVVGTMSAHPFMEDYMKDPIKNFALSATLGGVIGGGIGHIADRFVVKGIEGAAESAAVKTATTGMLPVVEGMPLVTSVQIRQQNIENLTSMLEGAASTEGPVKVQGLAKEYAEKFLLNEQKMQQEEFNTLASRLLAQVPKEHHEEFKQLLANDIRFQGLDAVTRFGVSEKMAAQNTFIPDMKEEFGSLVKKVKKTMPDGTVQEVEAAASRVYIPEFDTFVTPKDVGVLGRATALKGETAETIQKHKSLTQTAHQVPNNSAGFELYGKATPGVDKMYLDALAYVDQLDAAKLAKAAIDPDDIPMINALVARIGKEQGALQDLKVKLTRSEPSYDSVTMQKVFNANGVQADHHVQMAKFTNPTAIKKYDLFNAGDIGFEAKNLLSGWRAGSGVAKMRAAADAYLGGYGATVADAAAYGKIYNSKASTELRAEFSKLADADGNVYLWRGMTKDPTGHAALQSYTTDIDKAREFGQPRLFKVHVDDIVGAIADLKSKDGFMKNEIIVKAPKREVEARLPIANGMTVPASQAAQVEKGYVEVGAKELIDRLVQVKEDNIRSMLGQGRSLEEIAIRSNTPVDTIKAWVGNGMKEGSIATLQKTDGSLMAMQEYGSAQRIADYMDVKKAPLLLRSNVRKMPYAQLSANLDVQSLHTATNEIIETFFRQAADKSETIKEYTEFLYTEGMKDVTAMMRAQVSQAVNGKAGTRFFESADHFMRNMGEFGWAAAHIGKEIQRISNHAMERMVKPLAEHMEKISKDPAALLEANIALKLNAELKGHRIYAERQFWQKEAQLQADGTTKEVLVPATFQGKEYKVVSDSVDAMLTQLGKVGEELYHTKNTLNKTLGKPDLSNIGFWVPAFNPRNKHIAYVWNKGDNTTQILWGNTADELSKAIEAVKPSYAQQMAEGKVQIVTKSDQAAWNLLKGREDPINMQSANLESFHSGASTPLIVKANADVLGEIIGGLEHTVQAHVRQMAEISLYDISDNLQRISEMNQRFSKNQPLGPIMAAIHAPKDAAKSVRDILFSLDSLPNYTTWQQINGGFEGALGLAMHKGGELFQEVAKPLRGLFGKKDLAEIDMSKFDYKKMVEKMEAAGIPNPYEVFGKEAEKVWDVAKLTDSTRPAPRAIYAMNAFAATAALRFAEVAQPLVNAMSLPILTMAAIGEKLPETFLGAKLGTAKVNLAQAMHDGIRAMHSDHFQHWEAEWTKRGYFDPIVSEASKILKLPREFEPGVIAKIEKAVDNNFVTMMSKGADYSETLVRKTAMYTGAMLAKRMYPDLGDAGITIFARNFMDRAIGNYHAAQRPVFFQGTMGTAMGLFQTYMLTYAQSMYRSLELKDYKTLGKMMLAQGTVFGAKSLPGFNPVSEMIGEHYSDDHTDLSSGIVRAVPEPMAKAILYGLPSSLGPAFYTRGEVQPRVPNPANIASAAGIGVIGQVGEGVARVAQAAAVDGKDVPRALLEALSLQSISRPLARGSEILSGYSVTKAGNTVSTPEEVWTTTGILSRILSTRPTQEAILRDTIHANTLYNTLDREARQKVVGHLRTAIREGELGSEQMERWALDYMDNGGTSTGWRAAVNTAISQSNMTAAGPLRDKLKPTSSLNHMLDMLDE